MLSLVVGSKITDGADALLIVSLFLFNLRQIRTHNHVVSLGKYVNKWITIATPFQGMTHFY